MLGTTNINFSCRIQIRGVSHMLAATFRSIKDAVWTAVMASSEIKKCDMNAEKMVVRGEGSALSEHVILPFAKKTVENNEYVLKDT